MILRHCKSLLLAAVPGWLVLVNAFAATSKIGPGIRLGDDPGLLPENRRAQAEPHIIRSPIDANVLVATFQEGRFPDGGAVDCGYSISRDGGRTWTRELIPQITKPVDGGPFDRATDPVAAIDLRGAVYLNMLGVMGNPPQLSSVLISKSVDSGTRFSTPMHVAVSLSAVNFLDKNWMAINTFAGTPTANRIALAFTYPTSTNLPVGFSTQPIATTFSDDGGTSWSELNFLKALVCIGGTPVFLPDGGMAVFYWSYLNETSTASENRIEMAFSRDGGVSYEAARLVARPVIHDDSVARDGFNLFSVATDRQVGALYVTYQGKDLTTPRIFFTRSIDLGATWSAPVPVNDTPAARSVFNPAIAVSPDGQHVSIIFYDKRQDSGLGNFVDLYLAESFDGGVTWEPNARVSEVSSDLRLAPLTDRGRMLGDYQAIAADVDFETSAVACWIDTRTGSPDPFVARIQRERGTTFDAWRKLRFSTAELAEVQVSGADADPDGDGLTNFAEYASGTEPRRRDGNTQGLIVDGKLAPEQITLQYERLRVLGDVGFAWEMSSDLKNWSPVSSPSERVTPLADMLRERVSVDFSVGGTGGFFRLRLSPVPSASAR
ncbi:MAG: exo-alpha-sialidase [Pedosphaera sp.]|nr:exo-alpha-sialidase [Pedosphaera sp.]